MGTSPAFVAPGPDRMDRAEIASNWRKNWASAVTIFIWCPPKCSNNSTVMFPWPGYAAEEVEQLNPTIRLCANYQRKPMAEAARTFSVLLESHRLQTAGLQQDHSGGGVRLPSTGSRLAYTSGWPATN